MNLSVVIVNYNVKYFLEQCLISVFKSGKDIEMEVFVVDNASTDGSCQMVKQRFPEVKLIENSKNVGFSAANNQAIRIANGNFVLLLNPDTVVEEDTFIKCIQFMADHPNAGSMTVKMIDGKGRYLPESKRALPTPMVSFFKIFGFTKLFPHSKIFARYYLGHLDQNKTNKIEILPGAYMFIRKEVLDNIGLLDESFFMYGEDIDLSYRILKAGFENYYFPETRIIHYKGESTKKGSINYVLLFYKAMLLFAQKHFTHKNARLYMIVVFLAIYVRAFLSILKRILKLIYLPIIDILLITTGFLIIIPFWENYRYHTPGFYPDDLVKILVPIYILIWLLSLWLLGAYDKSQKFFAASKGVLSGTLIILAIYALLPEDFRFSRAVIILGSAWSLISIQGARGLAGIINTNLFPALRKKKRNAIIGSPEEAERVLGILNNSGINYQYSGLISPNKTIADSSQIATIDQLEEFIRVNEIDEVIFCSSNISSQEIIRNMLILSEYGIEYKIAPPESISIIGSNSINALGELYTPDFKAINTPASKRNKRLFDICSSLLLIVLSPIWFLLVKNAFSLFSNSFSVFIGKKTWVGYTSNDPNIISELPKIKKCVLPLSQPTHGNSNHSNEVNLIYAKNYSVGVDLSILWKRIVQ
ncbi:MAG: glycosyltransferase [Tenuifilaceae bacterium]